MTPLPARRLRFAALPLTFAFALTSVLAPTAAAAPAGPPSADTERSAQVAQEIKRAISDGKAPNAERKALAKKAVDALGMPALPAQMGQGEKRIAETGDAQVPTLDEMTELAQLAGGDSASVSDRGPASARMSGSTVAPAYTSGNGWWRPPGVAGVDVSSHQGNVNWSYAYSKGARFAYVKATQSWPTSVYKNPYFNQQYNGSYNAGMIRGAYHFAMPAASGGVTQARQFVARGGGWSADGRTLPPLLDIEWNPYSAAAFPKGKGDVCYGMTPRQLSDWIMSFGVEIKRLTGRAPMVYTARSWWDRCLNESSRFRNWPLHVARYPSSPQDTPGELPGGWTDYRLWQYSTTTGFNGSARNVDGNVFNGSWSKLRAFARNSG